MTEPRLHGSCTERFRSVRASLEDALDSGAELGASLAVRIDGRTEVDLWGGFRDEARTTAWTEDTITNLWSLTKTVTNLAALVLADRGGGPDLLHAPVAKYWPEFAAGGKQDIEVRHVLAHTSGVSGWEQPFATEDMYDRERATALLAAQTPWWEPGTAAGYHGHNQGHLVGEIVRRISGRTLTRFVAEEIAGPLGADFQIGAREADWDRIAAVVPPPPSPLDLTALDPDSPMVKTFTGPPPNAAAANTPAWRNAELGALNGHGNARSVARIMAAVSEGGRTCGVRLLSPETIGAIFQEQAHGTDLVLGLRLRQGIGYALPERDTLPYIPDGRICFWGGWGGSMVVMDLDRRMTVAYVMNRMAPSILGSPRSEAYLRAVYDAL